MVDTSKVQDRRKLRYQSIDELLADLKPLVPQTQEVCTLAHSSKEMLESKTHRRCCRTSARRCRRS
jgi:hypothetical protein